MKVGFFYNSYESLGVEYLSAALKRAGHETTLFWDPRLFNDSFIHIPRLARMFDYTRKVTRRICHSDIDLLAVSTHTDTFQVNLGITEAVKRRRPEITTVFGGMHVTGAPEATMRHEAIDFACVGEGEAGLTHLVNDLAAGGDGKGAPNMLYRENGELVRNPLAPLEDLNRLPWPDKELFYRVNPWYRGTYQVISTRNCVNACTFCHNSLFRQVYPESRKVLRRRSVDNLMEELVWAKQRYGLYAVKFFDEIFTFDKVWLAEFAERYTREVGLPYWCYVFPGHVDAEVVDLLQRSGCWEVEMGVQSIREEVRSRVLNRHETNAEIAEAISLFRGAGIKLMVDNIFGLPGQDMDELLEAAAFYDEHRPDRFKVYWLRYFPGTTILPSGLRMGHLTQDDVTVLEDGLGSRTLATGGTKGQQLFGRIQTWFIFLLFLPRWLNRWIANRKAFRFMPHMPFVGHLVSRAFDLFDRREQNEVTGSRYVKRYAHYWYRTLFR